MTKKLPGARRGRPCVFPFKTGGRSVHGVITKHGVDKFEQHRKDLAKLAKVAHPSDGDVIEYLTRGKAATKEYILSNAQE